ncbi:GNAT family N-acetyltransferase [Candidatus Falkowbacteria bacterium]|nr:GNAT family N-acetyltransferase [Candidatus Falkowbacteria bacterium]
MFIKTNQFIIRPFKLSDAADLARNINNAKVARYTTSIPYPYKLQYAHDWLAKQIKTYEEKRPENIVWAIEIDREVVGAIGIHKIIYGHKAELGAWIAQKHWNKGIMTQVIKIMTDYAFKSFKLKRIYARIFTPNLGSKAVAEKNGFKLEGIMKKDAKKDGKYYDVYLLSKTK